MFQRPSGYSSRRVKTLAEGYGTMVYLKSTKPGRGLDILCELADWEQALSVLDSKERSALLLVGQLGLTETEAAKLLGIQRGKPYHQSTVSRRYTRALEKIREHLNDDTA